MLHAPAMELASVPKQHITCWKPARISTTRDHCRRHSGNQRRGSSTGLKESEKAKSWFLKTVYVFKMRGGDILDFLPHITWIPYINATESTVCGLGLTHKLFLIQDKVSTEIKSKHLEIFIPTWRSNYRSVKSSNKKLWFVFCIYFFISLYY